MTELLLALRRLRSGWVLAAGCTLVGLVAGGLYASVPAPTYQSTLAFVIGTRPGADVGAATVYTDTRTELYTALASSPEATARVAAATGVSADDIALESALEHRYQLTLTVTAPSPESTDAAARAARSVVPALVDEVENPPTGDPGAGSSPVVVTLLQAPGPPEPAGPGTLVQVLVGGALGAVLGVGLALFLGALREHRRG
jgi:capsular polysaccharide biosynthesis protein